MNSVSQTENTSIAQETASGSPGTILRRCREFHGITLEEASETTKIGISHLKALEDDQIREFANQAYLKGFLRIYATFLGLNAEDIARMYDKLFGSTEENNRPDRKTKKTAAPRKRLVPLKKLILPALLLTAILITATLFKRPPAPLVRQAAPVAVPVPPPQGAAIHTAPSSAKILKPAPDITPPEVVIKRAEPAIPEKPLQTKNIPDVTKSFILKLKVVQNGNLTATIDGNIPQQYVLTSGDIIEWKAEKRIALDLSNGDSVEVELNGKPFKLTGSPGKPVYLELDAASVTP